jgi:hypothetical protein
LDRVAVEAGGILRLRLNWELRTGYRPDDDLTFIWNVLDYQSANYGSVQQTFSPEKWQPETITTYHVIPINPDAPAGRYDLQLAIGYKGGTFNRQIITSVKIPMPADQLFTEPPLVTFEDGQQRADLMNAVLESSEGQIRVNLVWRAGSSFGADYSVFIHLTPSDDPIPLVQGDAPPLNGRYPTSIWAVGEIIEDTHTLDITSLPPGDYVIRVGLFHPEWGRLPSSQGDSIIVGEVSR